MIIRVDGVYSHIECDVKGCPERSPPAEVMVRKRGLAGCGWYLDGRGAHRCPAHYEANSTPTRGPQERTTRQQRNVDQKYGRA